MQAMILHVDMDAFYASVEIRDRPELAGRPVVVGGSPDGRGVVAAASYVARRFGIRSAMPAAQARRLCPQAVFLPSRIAHYAEISGQIRAIFERYTPIVEPLSLDEAFLDVRSSEKLFGPSDQVGQRIKNDIRGELNLVASVGVAPNKFLAKLASDLHKPDGFLVVNPEDIETFLDPLPVNRLWGVGNATDRALHRLGLRTIGQLRRLPRDWLVRQFGHLGEHLWRLARGRDERPVVAARQAKSVSHETTFEHDIGDPLVLRTWLRSLAEQVGFRLRQSQYRGRTVVIKVRYGDFTTITRSHTLAEATDITDDLWRHAGQLFERLLPLRAPVRLLGVGVADLQQPQQQQPDLFGEAPPVRKQELDRVADAIRTRFGKRALRRGVAPD
jgi:DNA polymerase-4